MIMASKHWVATCRARIDRGTTERFLYHALSRRFGRVDRGTRDARLNLVLNGVTYELPWDSALVEAATKAVLAFAALHQEWEAARAAEP